MNHVFRQPIFFHKDLIRLINFFSVSGRTWCKSGFLKLRVKLFNQLLIIPMRCICCSPPIFKIWKENHLLKACVFLRLLAIARFRKISGF